MPRDSCIRTTLDERLGEEWTVTDDLLAMLIEVSSVTASGRQIKKPIEVPRPKDKRKGPQRHEQQTPARSPQDAAYSKAIGVLAATTRR